MRYCENCELRYPDTSRYCQQCGAKLVFRPEAVDRQKVLSILKRLPGNKKILKNCKIKNYDDEAFFDFILIHEAGIFAFQISESYRILEGSDRMRFWKIENLSDHSVQMLERPVSVLEKKQYILDQVLREGMFAKTFAFLIYPENSGLEKIQSSKTDQMLTIPRMEDILTRYIRDYGHVYSEPEIEKIVGILRGFQEEISAPLQTFSKQGATAKHSSPLVRRTAVIILISSVVFALLYSFFVKQEKAHTPQATAPASYIPVQSQKISGFTIPGQYAALFRDFSNADLDKVSSAFDFNSMTKQENGAVSISLPSDRVEHALTTLRSAIDEITARLLLDRQLPNITSVRSDTYRDFTIFVTSMDLIETEKVFTEELLRFGVLYAALSDGKYEDVSASFYSQTGDLYQTVHAADSLHR